MTSNPSANSTYYCTVAWPHMAPVASCRPWVGNICLAGKLPRMLCALKIVIIEALLKEILSEVAIRMVSAYAEANRMDNDHPLAQQGQSNGTSIALNYLEYNESKLGLENLLCMVNGPTLALSATTKAALAQLC